MEAFMQDRGTLEPNQHTQELSTNDPYAKFRVTLPEPRKMKMKFYNKRFDMYSFSSLKDNDVGCLFYSTDQLLSNIRISSFQDSSYVYFMKNKHLVYVIDGQIEDVSIEDINKFNFCFNSIMKTRDGQYDYKLLSPEEIYLLVTENGGHVPKKIEGSHLNYTLSDVALQELKNKFDQVLLHENNKHLGVSSEHSNEDTSEEDSLDISTVLHPSRGNRKNIENFFYDKSLGLYGTEEVYELPENISALHWVGNEYDMVDCQYADYDYIFVDKVSKLFFVTDMKFEPVVIEKMDTFITQFKEIMETERCKYDYKCLPKEKIHNLIISSQGLLPAEEQNQSVNALNVMSNSTTKCLIQLMQKSNETNINTLQSQFNGVSCNDETDLAIGSNLEEISANKIGDVAMDLPEEDKSLLNGIVKHDDKTESSAKLFLQENALFKFDRGSQSVTSENEEKKDVDNILATQYGLKSSITYK
jgi:hypothetical protein